MRRTVSIRFVVPVVCAGIFASKVVRPFTILTEFMNKRPPAKRPQAKIQTAKKQIPVKKIAPDRIEELVKKHLGNIGEAENALRALQRCSRNTRRSIQNLSNI